MGFHVAGTPTVPGARSTTGLAHLRVGLRTRCGLTVPATWTELPWQPPTGCCKTCTRLSQ